MTDGWRESRSSSHLLICCVPSLLTRWRCTQRLQLWATYETMGRTCSLRNVFATHAKSNADPGSRLRRSLILVRPQIDLFKPARPLSYVGGDEFLFGVGCLT